MTSDTSETRSGIKRTAILSSAQREKTEAGGHRLPDAIYDPLWIQKIKARCAIDSNSCWLWTGSRHTKGYAQAGYRGETVRLHRKLYELTNGITLSSTQFVCHLCDVRHCCNPAHGWVGTAKDNNNDCASKERHHNTVKTHCKRGHEYTPGNTYIKPDGARSCKACKNEQQLRKWHNDPAFRARQMERRRARRRSEAV